MAPRGALEFQLLFQRAPGLFLVLEPTAPYTILDASDAYLRATLTRREAIVGRGLFDMFPDNPEDLEATGTRNLRASLERVASTGNPDAMAVQKYDIRRPDSEGGGFEERFWSPVNSPVPGPDGRVLYIIHRVEDVTEFVRVSRQGELQLERNRAMELEILTRSRELDAANKQLRLANEQLSELDRAKTAFFSNISHEFRTPLTLLLGPLEDRLADRREPLTASQRASLELAHDNALRLLKLVNALLDFARLEAGRVRASFVATDLARFTEDLASTFRSALEKAGLRLVVECAALPEPAYVDRDMWEKVVLNLLSNAYKHTFAGEVRVRLREEGDVLRLHVDDTGAGIAAAELPRIFERFYRVPGTPSRTHEGTGIGLSLVREFLKLHGGTVSVESTPGTGTRFTVTLPRGRAHLPPETVETGDANAAPRANAALFAAEARRWTRREAEDAPAAASEKRILVADDNADLRAYVRSILESTYTVETVEDGAAALEAALRNPPSLVLTDVMMPKLDGLGLLRELRARETTRAIPVVLLSARAGEEAAADALDAGADDYVVKPFSARELLSRVRTHLTLYEMRRAVEQRAARLEAEERLQQSAKMEAIGRLAAGVAHDFNNLITIIGGYCELIRSSLGADHPALTHLDQVGQAALRAAGLTRQMLAFSRKQRLEPRVISVNAVVGDTVALLRRTVPPKVVIETDLDPALARVKADATQLGQMLLNLGINARDAMPSGGRIVVATRNVEVDAALVQRHPDLRAGPHVMVSVADTGTGIPPDVLPRVFEPFFTTKGEGRGTGLGLAIVHGIVKQSGGEIAVETEPGRGTVFRVYLPRTDEQPEPANVPVGESRAAQRATILVLDDEPAILKLVSLMLRGAGYDVLSASTPHEATDLASAPGRRIDLLLSDVALPGMNGPEVAAALRTRFPSVRVLFMSGHSDHQLAAGLMQGADFIAKPVGRDDLLKKVQEVIARPQA